MRQNRTCTSYTNDKGACAPKIAWIIGRKPNSGL